MEGRWSPRSLGAARPSSSPSTTQTQPRQDHLFLPCCSQKKVAQDLVVPIESESVLAGDISCKKEAKTSEAEGASSCQDSWPAVEPEVSWTAGSWRTDTSCSGPGFDPGLFGHLDTKVGRNNTLIALMTIAMQCTVSCMKMSLCLWSWTQNIETFSLKVFPTDALPLLPGSSPVLVKQEPHLEKY